MAEHEQIDAQPLGATSTLWSADGQLLKEWAECRATIGRLDTILEDLRKIGFSLVTALLTANAFFGFSTPSAAARVAISSAIMVLIAALFSLDTYYEALHSGAVERALDLESYPESRIRITRYISTNALKTKAVFLTLGLYLGLLVTASGLGVLAGASANSSGAAAAVVIVGVILLLYMLLYWMYVARQTHLYREKKGRKWSEWADA
jgi:hypothetical protein